MANKLKNGKYECLYCKLQYDDPFEADRCRDSHDLVYIPISRTDLNRLLAFIYTRNEKELTETLVNTLLHYRSLKQ